jgi:hypothetical protein
LIPHLLTAGVERVIPGYNLGLSPYREIEAAAKVAAQGYRPLTGEVRPATELQAV